MTDPQPPAHGSVWRHYKGGIYRVLRVEADTVHYLRMSDDTEWDRKLADWHEHVDSAPYHHSGPRYAALSEADSDRHIASYLAARFRAECEAEWPALSTGLGGSWEACLRYDIAPRLHGEVQRMRSHLAHEAKQRAEREALEAAQAARPEHAQQAAIAAGGLWWWPTDDGRWTDGARTENAPSPGVVWYGYIGEGGRVVHEIHGAEALCGRYVDRWRPTKIAPQHEATCTRCLRRGAP